MESNLKRACERSMRVAMQRCKDLRREYQRIFWKVRESSTVDEAYSAANQLDPEISEAYKDLFELMPDYEGLRKGLTDDLEKAFEFCETDILAFRCGYEKAEIFEILKSSHLSPKYCQRVRDMILMYIQWPGIRREFRELSRLAIPYANEGFVESLNEIYLTGSDKLERKKAQILLYKVLNGRSELRSIVPLSNVDIRKVDR